MNVFELFGTIAVNNKGANEALKDTTQKAERAGKQIQEAFKKVGSATVKAGQTIGKAAIAVGTAWAATVETTREYRTAMAKLDTAFTTNGHSAEAATKTYKALQAVLGDTDQAVEAANHLAIMCKNEEELNKWTDICTGVFAQFGDSLPLEGLTEAANETVKVGQVTGSLADALNWAGISEDDFNLKLRACRTEQERQKLILDTLYPKYKAQAEQYKENAESIMKANEANDNLTRAMSKLGEIGEPIMTGMKNWIADMINASVPHLETLITKLTEIDSVWNDVIWPLVQSTFKVAFGVDVPEWSAIETQVTTWWDETAKPAIEEKFKAMFGIEPPTWSEIPTEISTWWTETAKPAIEEKFKSTFGIDPPTWSEIPTSISTWWTETAKPAIEEKLKSTFGIEPPTWSEIPTAISTWWTETAKPKIEGIATALMSLTTPDLSAFAENFKFDWGTLVAPTLLSLLTGNYLHIVPVIGTALAGLITSNWDEHIKPTLDNFLNQELDIQLPDWGQLGTDILTGLNGLVTPEMEEAFQTIGGSLKDAFGSGMNAIETVLSGAKDFGQWVVDNNDTVKEFFGALTGNALDNAEGGATLIQLIGESIEGLAQIGTESVTGMLKWMLEHGEATALAIDMIAGAFMTAAIAAHPYATAVLAVVGAIGLLNSEWGQKRETFDHMFDGYSEADIEVLNRYVDAMNAVKAAEDAALADTTGNSWGKYDEALAAEKAALDELLAIDGLLSTYNTWHQAQVGYAGGNGMALKVPVQVDENSETDIQNTLNGMTFDAVVKMLPDYSGLQSSYYTYFGGGSSGRTPMSKASGLDEVPYDGFYAHLHKGEAILNKSQADQWRGGGSGKVEALLSQVVTLLSQQQNIVLDSGVMVGQLAPAMDARLGTIGNRKGRGN